MPTARWPRRRSAPTPIHFRRMSPSFTKKYSKDSYSYPILQVRMPLPPQAPRIAWPDSVLPYCHHDEFSDSSDDEDAYGAAILQCARERNLGPPRCPLRGRMLAHWRNQKELPRRVAFRDSRFTDYPVLAKVAFHDTRTATHFCHPEDTRYWGILRLGQDSSHVWRFYVLHFRSVPCESD